MWIITRTTSTPPPDYDAYDHQGNDENEAEHATYDAITELQNHQTANVDTSDTIVAGAALVSLKP